MDEAKNINRMMKTVMVKSKKRYLTLIEIMIVIFLIMVITGALAYNLKGSLDEGKAAATEIGMRRVADQLELAVAKNPDLLDHIESDWVSVLKQSPMVQNPQKLSKDEWGQTYDVRVVDGRIEVNSKNLEEYKKKHGSSSRH